MATNKQTTERLLAEQNRLLKEQLALVKAQGGGGTNGTKVNGNGTSGINGHAQPPLATAKPLPPFSMEIVDKGNGDRRVKLSGHCAVPLTLKPEQLRRLFSKGAEVLAFLDANGF